MESYQNSSFTLPSTEEEKDERNPAKDSCQSAAIAIGAFQIILVILFAISSAEVEFVTESEKFDAAYGFFSGVLIMMFLGFGYLMTFMTSYGVGSVGISMLIAVIGLQWALLTEKYFQQIYALESHFLSFDMFDLIGALYGVAAILISFGGVIGKLSPYQLVLMTIIEMIIYSANHQIVLAGWLKLMDVGGTIIIHMFGAYFGLAVAWVVGPAQAAPQEGYVAELFAFLGTLFLWIYWPSFVAGDLYPGSDQQQRAVIATIIALAASTTMTFCCSALLNKDYKFRVIDIQNATLAGGVAIGVVANLTIDIVFIALIGGLAGIVSTIGFSVIQPKLEELSLHDTCGIHNLHGMPSIIGAMASVIIAAYKQMHHTDEDVYYHPNQWAFQLIAIPITLAVAIAAGISTGMLLQSVEETPFTVEKVVFQDSLFFEKPNNEERLCP